MLSNVYMARNTVTRIPHYDHSPAANEQQNPERGGSDDNAQEDPQNDGDDET